MADQQILGPLDPHEKIGRIEEHIEELAVKLESCRKFILASRVAVAGSGLVLAAILVGAIRSDLGLMSASVALFLGGIVIWGSNGSTARETAMEITAAEIERATLIEQLNPRCHLIADKVPICAASQKFQLCVPHPGHRGRG
jgi:hypothetical protein